MSTNRESRRPGRDARDRDTRQKERATPTWATEPNSPRALTTATLTVGGAMAATLLVIVVIMSGVLDTLFQAPVPTPIAGLTPPAVTPLASPPAEHAGDDSFATIQTEFGEITIELFTESSPVAAQNFINLAEAGFYDGVIFHRVVPGFVIQGGDPTGTGGDGPGYTIPADPVVGDHVRGMVSMAHSGDPNSGGSQFFIVLDDAPHLKPLGHAIFGEVVEGMEVVDEIAAQPGLPEQPERPVDPVEMITVVIDRPT